MFADHKVVASSRAGARPARTQIEAWLDEARAGSAEALGSLFEGCRKYLLFMANRALDSDLRPKAAASDLVQDSFVEVQRDFATFRGTSEEEVLAWLTAILANRLANNVRHLRLTGKRSVNREVPLEVAPQLEVMEACEVSAPLEAAIAREEGRRVQVAMTGLSEPHRTVIVLRTWERRSFNEIGTLMSTSPEAARKLWSRAVRTLEKVLCEP